MKYIYLKINFNTLNQKLKFIANQFKSNQIYGIIGDIMSIKKLAVQK